MSLVVICHRLLSNSVRKIFHSLSQKRGCSFLNPSNCQYLERLYNQWREDPISVPESWAQYFNELACEPNKEFSPQTSSSGISTSYHFKNQIQKETDVEGTLDLNATIRAYQARGHLIADTDPLGIQNSESSKLRNSTLLPPEIVIRKHLQGLTETDMTKKFPLGTISQIGGEEKVLPLGEIVKRLNNVYCGHLGLEYIYIHDSHVLDWLRNKFEWPGAWQLPEDHRRYIWIQIMKAVTFENLLAKKFGGEKRFGLEGCESFVASMIQCLETSSEHGVDSICLGMAHRGRLNVLANVCDKPLHQLFTQFKPLPLEGLGSGDVKYHLGTWTEKHLPRSGKTVKLSVMANPSHLEAVGPIVVGRIRAEQVARNNKNSLAFVVHGDAAFAGQGVCYETMVFTHLPDYTTGGVIHFVINNQIGFTTDPRYARSSAHCTDVARVVNAPIFHVHADDPDLVAYCSKIAMDYRAEFHNDIVLDIVGYRRNGHNETDEPSLTQPIMYKKIKSHPNVLQIYTDKLLKEGVVDELFVQKETEKYLDYCEKEFKEAQSKDSMRMEDWYDVPWVDFFAKQNPSNPIPATGISIEDIQTICRKVSSPPKDIKIHNAINRLLDRRTKLSSAGEIDWGMGECIAIGSLLKDGYHVRLSGEDVERGTFSHRNHIIHDQERDKTYVNVLHGIFPNQALYTICNSPLSEFGVLGFELGYSSFTHESLVIWEAQFGDFGNNCQVILDNFLCSQQSKWGRQVGLVLLLPHGMEGQGPEHSSSRVERFLQLCDDDLMFPTEDDSETQQLFDINWIICNVTTPANLVHVLRRQMLMPFRKPLCIMTPKSLLRHPQAVSSFEEIGPNTRFQALIPDYTQKNADQVEKVVICCGKVYYDLIDERKKQNLNDKIAILRIEQISPFPYKLLIHAMAKYSKPKVMWLQEEHRNQGCFSYVRERIALALDINIEEVVYGGRPPSSSPATGSKVIYKAEFENMLKDAMRLD